MLHTIAPGTHSEHASLLTDMFAMRDRVVVGEWGWTIPGAIPGRERDRFDTDETAYFIATGEPGTRAEGRVVACARLNPTTGPHMMPELFSEFCNLQKSPVGPTVWECSRYLSDNRLLGDRLAGKRARSLVNLGMLDFALSNGIDTFVWLTHQLMYGHMLTVWESEPLGTPRRAEGEDSAWIAGRSRIDREARRRVRDVLRRLDTAVREPSETFAHAEALS